MPYLNVKLSVAPSAELAKRVAETLATHTAEILGKKPEVTAIAVEFVEPAQWFVGGRPVDARSTTTFYLDVKITEGTNTKAEKTHYIARVFEDMQSAIGPLTPASYIVIDDVRADAWGFEGKTQEYRFISKQMN